MRGRCEGALGNGWISDVRRGVAALGRCDVLCDFQSHLHGAVCTVGRAVKAAFDHPRRLDEARWDNHLGRRSPSYDTVWAKIPPAILLVESGYCAEHSGALSDARNEFGGRTSLATMLDGDRLWLSNLRTFWFCVDPATHSSSTTGPLACGSRRCDTKGGRCAHAYTRPWSLLKLSAVTLDKKRSGEPRLRC